MFGIFNKKLKAPSPPSEWSSSSDVPISTKTDEPKTDFDLYPLGAYKIAPSTTYDENHNTIPCYVVMIHTFDYHSVYSKSRTKWEAWGHPSTKTFDTVQEAKIAYEIQRKQDHKIMMHLCQPHSEIYNPYEFIKEEVKELGVEKVQVEYNSTSRFNELVFETQEDLNLYGLSGEYLEVRDLIFKVKE